MHSTMLAVVAANLLMLIAQTADAQGFDRPGDKLSKCGKTDDIGDIVWKMQPAGFRVIGGNSSSAGKWPWQVAIARKTRPLEILKKTFGGGSVIGNGWILTAAHLFGFHCKTRFKGYTLILGTHRLDLKLVDFTNENSTIRVFEPDRIYCHENFSTDAVLSPQSIDYDIALIKLGRELMTSGNQFVPRGSSSGYVTFNPNIRPVCLPCSEDGYIRDDPSCLERLGSDNVPSSTVHVVTGFGHSSSPIGQRSRAVATQRLQQGIVRLRDKRECTTAIRHRNYNFTERMICALGHEQGRVVDACAGDSGGPLIRQDFNVANSSGRWMQVGIVSFGLGCGMTYIKDGFKFHFPGYYTNVLSFLPWIKSTINGGTWTTWSPWNSCSALCGRNGVQFRYRICSSVLCRGPSVDHRRCGSTACQAGAVWSRWTSWTTCLSIDGTRGVQRRTRRCMKPSCTEPSVMRRICLTPKPLPSWSAWSSWTKCSATNCDQRGFQSRSRKCNKASCVGSESVNRSCKGPVCPPGHCSPGRRWSNWLNVDRPSVGTGDFETLINFRRVYGKAFCPGPTQINARSARFNDIWPFHNYTIKQPSTMSNSVGFICRNADQLCLDYEVRLCCPIGTADTGDFAPEPGDCPLETALARNGILDTNRGVPCASPCDESGKHISDEQACRKAKYCAWIYGACFGNYFNVDVPPNNEWEREMLFDIPNAPTSLSGGNGSLFQRFRSQTRYIGQNTLKVKFPDNCSITRANSKILSLLDPPFNIPYCSRIQCRENRPDLDFSRFACQLHPGCYFDQQLHQLRTVAGPGILAGVPTCHLVIRHENFVRKVFAATASQGKSWNSVYTNCFLEQNPGIFDDVSCKGLNFLNYFGVPSKQLGWKGITKRECKMLGGCFKALANECYYPPDQRGAVQVPDFSQLEEQTGDSFYGRQRCAAANASGSPAQILGSYHSCRRAGCAVDAALDAGALEFLLCKIARSDAVPLGVKSAFWSRVRSGHCGADNWKDCVEKLREDRKEFLCSPQYPFPPQGYPPNPLPNYPPQSYLPQSYNPQYYPSGGEHLPGCTGVFGYPLTDYRHYGLYPLFNPFNIVYPYSVPCPFHQYKFPGILPLRGSFQDCCTRSFCYISWPKAPKGRPISGVAPYYSPWGHWGDCSTSCGPKGARKRSRRCVTPRADLGGCHGKGEEKKKCTPKACPHWGPWGAWGPCDQQCGPGNFTRSRSCISATDGGGCPGRGEQKGVCNIAPCPKYGAWGDWGTCNVTMGHGTANRTRSCSVGIFPCNYQLHSIVEFRDCVIYCTAIDISSWVGPPQPCLGAWPNCRRVRYLCPCDACNPPLPPTEPCDEPSCLAKFVKREPCHRSYFVC